MPYQIEIANSVKQQLEALTASERALLFEAMEQQLTHEPLVATRNRKMLRPNPIAPWELRVGELRVFYDVQAKQEDTEVAEQDAAAVEPGDQERDESPTAEGVVLVLAVGKKEGGILRIGGRRVQL